MNKSEDKRLHPIAGAVVCLLGTMFLSLPVLAETVTGSLGEAVDGDTLILDGRNFDLSGIVSPVPGFMCTLRNRESNCGSIARGGLLDLMAGATVTCETDGSGWICSAGGYDLAQNMVHTGWAVPERDDDPRFTTQLERAQNRNQGLWRADPELTIGEIRAAGQRQ